MNTTTEVFRAALVELKLRSNAKIPDIAKAAGVSTRHIQGVLSEKEKKGLGAAAQYQVAAFFGMRVTEMMALGERLLAGIHTPSGGAIATGAADIDTHPTTTPHHPSGPDPPQPPDQEDDDKLPTAPQAIEMTREVLASRTIYRGALLQNIKAFHKAVQGEQEMSSLRDDMQDMKQQMAAMQAMMARIERNTAAALPVETPTQKRDVQGG
jgi:hypothetical protein